MPAALIEGLSEIRSVEDADRYGERLRLLTHRRSAIALEPRIIDAKLVLDEARARDKEIADEIAALAEVYEPQIVKLAKRKLPPGQRTFLTALLEVAFRAVNTTTIDVVDPAKGVPFIVRHCPEAIVHEPKVIKRQFTKAFVERVSGMTKTALVRAGLAVTKPHDSVTVKLRG